jgi:acyl-CoA reductase-like NAD-dependent aldehyde dehydrogenase
MGSAGPQFDIWSNYLNVIDGKTVGTSETRNGINPANGKANPQVPVSTQKDVDAAVDAGRKAFKSWSQTSWAERTKAVLAYADAIEQHTEDFAKLLTQEQGKPVSCIPIQSLFATDSVVAYVRERRSGGRHYMASCFQQAGAEGRGHSGG